MTVDQDGDGLANFIDIDADGDGVVDNIEFRVPHSLHLVLIAMETALMINMAWRHCVLPFNQDGDAQPYLDTDTDNDFESDEIEAHDTDGDGIVSDSDNSSSNTGQARS